MNKNFPKPKLFVSKCLGFAACRWDGLKISGGFVRDLKGRVNFVTACPEVEIGLGVPRDKIRIVGKGKKRRLIQLNTKKDLTAGMRKYAARFVGSLGNDIDGFILKSRSPSCGIKDAKVYPDLKSGRMLGRASGFFASEVLKRFPRLPVETEARLKNRNIRKRFLTRLFASAAKRKKRREGSK